MSSIASRKIGQGGTDRFDVSYMPGLRRKRGYVAVRHRPNNKQDAFGVTCRACGASFSQLVTHVNRIHLMSVAEYRERFGQDAQVMSRSLLSRWISTARKAAKKRRVKLTCVVCGAKWMQVFEGYSLTCSSECNSKYQSKVRKSDPRFAETARKNAEKCEPWRERLRRQRIADRKHVCTICGSEWIAARPSKMITAGVCSYPCRAEFNRREKAREDFTRAAQRMGVLR